jgi:Zn-dependent protease/CBS domain-containing protein
MRDSLRLGRIAGFPVAVHWSVVVVVLLLAWSLADGVLPEVAPGRAAGTYWLYGVVGALLLLCSLLAHELSHAIVARRSGVEVEGLTLWMFGGVANLRGEPPAADADLRIAVAGPATSVGLSVGFGALAVVLSALGQSDLLVSVTAWLAGINLMLAVFNLIPGAPLDGGRILRASLWRRWGDRDRAAAAATRAGQLVGYCLVGLGLLNFLLGDYVGGLWMMLIGWFLHAAAIAEESAAVTVHTLEGVPVAAFMSTDVQTGQADLSVEEFVSRLVLGGRHSAYPVVGVDGTVTGLVTLGQLRGVPPGARASTSVGDVAVPLAHVATCTPDEPVAGVLPRLSRESGNRALVFDHGRLVGIVTPSDVTRMLETRSLLSSAGR